MYLLYVDESITYIGSKQYYILAGVSIFERQVYWLSNGLDDIAARFNQDDPHSVELHASRMFGGNKRWNKYEKAYRHQAIKDVLAVLGENHKGGSRIFAAVVEKGKFNNPPHFLKEEITGRTLEEYAFLQIASRFDYYIQRLRAKDRENNQRGIMLFDKSRQETALQILTRIYREEGHPWGRLKGICEVPCFIDSKASRLIQLADAVAWAINRKIQGDDEFYEIISKKFDHEKFDDKPEKKHGFHIIADDDIIKIFE